MIRQAPPGYDAVPEVVRIDKREAVMTATKWTTTVARHRSGPRGEVKVMHTQNLVQRSVSAIPILVWAGLLALYPAPSWGQDWRPAPPMPTARYSLAAAASPDGQTIYALGGAR